MDVVAYGEAHNQAMLGIENMLFEMENPMAQFKKSVYSKNFQEYCSKHQSVLDAIDTVYQMEEDPSVWCRKLADHLIDAAEAQLEMIPRKGKRGEKQMNYNMILVTYVFPALLETKKKSGEEVSDAIIAAWNERFKMNIGKASFEKIEEGFQRKFCYITTAVCESLGREDDCYELELLRHYRDGYLMQTREGQAMVEEYYDIAPTIVTRINREETADLIYRNLWEAYLKQCIQYIETGQQEACKACYKDMVLDLKKKYIA